MKVDFTLKEIVELKTIAVKAQNFELASKCREVEKNHPKYKQPKKNPKTQSLKNWIITTEFIPELIKKYGTQAMKLELLKHKKKPVGKRITP